MAELKKQRHRSKRNKLRNNPRFISSRGTNFRRLNHAQQCYLLPEDYFMRNFVTCPASYFMPNFVPYPAYYFMPNCVHYLAYYLMPNFVHYPVKPLLNHDGEFYATLDFLVEHQASNSMNCEGCNEAKENKLPSKFHLCVKDEITLGFQSRFGPIARPVKHSDEEFEICEEST